MACGGKERQGGRVRRDSEVAFIIENLRIEDKEKKLVDLEVDEIREEWSQAFWKLMG
jgi:hypothetical protein